MGVALIGSGKALPALTVGNDVLSTMVDTNDEWIVSRTGIHNRRIAQTETGVDLAVAAARDALGWTGGGWCPAPCDAESIDLVIVATATPDALVPSTGALVKRELGLSHAVAFDINAACTGFIYGLLVAMNMMHASLAGAPGVSVRRTLVIGAERLSRITDWTDRSTCILFGDGAGAAVLETRAEEPGIMGAFVKNHDDTKDSLYCGMEYRPTPFDADDDKVLWPQHLVMHGQQVFKFAANAMAEAIIEVLNQAGVPLSEVKRIVPHQANERIIKYAAQKLDLPLERFQISLHDTGNVSSASVPMALADLYLDGGIEPGDKILLVAFGGGLTSGAVLFEAS